MRNVGPIYARELRSYLVSPIAYVVGTLFLVFNGLTFWILLNLFTLPGGPAAEEVMQYFFGNTFYYWVCLLLFCPVITMRLLAEEQRSGTWEMLMTAPVTDADVVLGKYAGALTFFTALWVPTVLYFVWLGQRAPIDWGTVAGGYLGTWLLGALLLAIGVMASSLTRNQIIAVILALVIGIVWMTVGLMAYFVADAPIVGALQYLSIVDHTQEFARGVVDSRRIVLYLSSIAVVLFITVRIVESRRWRS